MFQTTILPILLFIIGMILIIKGGDWFVDSASWIAEVLGVPKFIIGATIVSIATTLPEMIVSINATAKGQVDMAAGNAIGSVTANAAMIMGIFIICMPFSVQRREFTPKALIMIASTGLLLFGCVIGSAVTVERVEYAYSLSVFGAVSLLIMFIIFFVENFLSMKKNSVQIEPSPNNIGLQSEDDIVPSRETATKRDWITNILFFLIGAAAIVVGADLLVDNGEIIAVDILKIPERVVSVLLIAIGTSLPELITTITALKKKEGALSVGNILGANIIDITLILSICSFVSIGKGNGNLAVSASTVIIDLPVCLGVTALATIPTIITKKFHRWQGLLLLAVYIVYCVLTVTVLQTV